jgi:arylsulfatase A-like enzyme
VTDRPNILLILTDQQRGDCVAADPLAPAPLQTPNLDFLARSGAHFLRAYAECPSCIPARRALMTGMAPAANGAVGFRGAEWNPPATLAGELSGAGYQTEMIGKLHLHPARRRYGFDRLQLANATRGADNEYVDWLRSVHGRNEVHPGMAHGVSSNGWVGRPHHLPEEQMHSFWVVDRAMEFLQRRDPSCPFFLNLSFIDPHPPLTPPRPYYDRYIDRDLPPPDIGDWADDLGGPQRGLDPNASRIHLDEDQMRCARAAYYGMVNFIDDQLGRLMQFAGGLSDTLILYIGPRRDARRSPPLPEDVAVRGLGAGALPAAGAGQLGCGRGNPAVDAGGSAGRHAHPPRRRRPRRTGQLHRPQPAADPARRGRRRAPGPPR